MSSMAEHPSLVPFSFDTDNKLNPNLIFPSPPSSETGGLDFDHFDSFTHLSPRSILLDALPIGEEKAQTPKVSFDLDLDQSPVASTCTPTSTTLISPKSSNIEIASIPQLAALNSINHSDADTAEALSLHHLQRYHHYRALATGVQEDQFDALFASCNNSNLLMPGPGEFNESSLYKDTSNNNNNMLAYQPQPVPTPYYGVSQQVSNWGQPTGSFTYHPQSSQAALHAQAQAHLQAADVARVQAQQQRASSSPTYFVPSSNRSSFESAVPQFAPYPRPPTSTLSANSPPYPSTPVYAGVPDFTPIQMSKTSTSASLPSFVSQEPSPVVRRAVSNDGSEHEGEDELAEFSPPPRTGLEELKPMIPGMPIPNAHGGGRGYVPGQTPDDPKKRHKCQICGRAFARAFNLKSHIQTHNPLRPKPYQCPHTSCKRGFSRLHDLERHRQGIHSDGPLVEAKRHGVSPAVARAQNRMQKRAESGSLI